MVGKSGSSLEKKIWELMITNFKWQPSELDSISIPKEHLKAGRSFQLFEVMFTKIMSQIRSDYNWYVTPADKDKGIDFYGEKNFFGDSELFNSYATLMIAGQCKKADSATDFLDLTTRDLTLIHRAKQFAFYVFALSKKFTNSDLNELGIKWTEEEGRMFVVQRPQVEALINRYLPYLEYDINQALSKKNAKTVISYFETKTALNQTFTTQITVPSQRIKSGEKFRVHIELMNCFLDNSQILVQWTPAPDSEFKIINWPELVSHKPVTLNTHRGVIEENFNKTLRLDFLTFGCGNVSPGELTVFVGSNIQHQQSLGTLQSDFNDHPAYYGKPYKKLMSIVGASIDNLQEVKLVQYAVTGFGGSGKTRFCEAVIDSATCNGADHIGAKQTKNHTAPYQILRELLVSLAGDPGNVAHDIYVVEKLSLLNIELKPNTIKLIRDFVRDEPVGEDPSTKFDLLHVFLVLIFYRLNSAPLLIHLQDLHRCPPSMLQFLSQLFSQVNTHLETAVSPKLRKLIVLFEGRVREQSNTEEADTSSNFEAFISDNNLQQLHCNPFSTEETKEFVSLLFDSQKQNYKISNAGKNKLIEEIVNRSSGLPFYCVQQARYLREQEILAIDQTVGRYFVVRLPHGDDEIFPDNVKELVERRWSYVEHKSEGIALLIWAISIVSDRIKRDIFNKLKQQLCHFVTDHQIQSFGFLDFGQSESDSIQFTHENYYQFTREIFLESEVKTRVLDIYWEWYKSVESLTIQQMQDYAGVLLRFPIPKYEEAYHQLTTILLTSDISLNVVAQQKALETLLEQIFDAKKSLFCDGEGRYHYEQHVELTRVLVTNGYRKKAITRADENLHLMWTEIQNNSPNIGIKLIGNYFSQVVTKIRTLMNHYKASEAAEIAEEAKQNLQALQTRAPLKGSHVVDKIQIELQFAQAVALAIDGNDDIAAQECEEVMELVNRSTNIDFETKIDALNEFTALTMSTQTDKAEEILRESLEEIVLQPVNYGLESLIKIHLGMVLIYQAEALSAKEEREEKQHKLSEAITVLSEDANIFRAHGYFANSAAAYLLLGVAIVMEAESKKEYEKQLQEAKAVFSNAVNYATLSHQKETLWRALYNLAVLKFQLGIHDRVALQNTVAALTTIQSCIPPVYDADTPKLQATYRCITTLENIKNDLEDKLIKSTENSIHKIPESLLTVIELLKVQEVPRKRELISSRFGDFILY